MRRFVLIAALALVLASCATSKREETRPSPPATSKAGLQEFKVPKGSHPHDVAPAKDGGVWYTAQATGKLGLLDPSDGSVDEIDLPSGSAPHGVIVGPDGAPYVTDQGLNAIVRVHPETHDVRLYPMPGDRPKVSPHTAVFDKDGTLWFTGNAGFYGSVDVQNGAVRVFDAPGGSGPYGITATSDAIYFASLAQSYIARVEILSGKATRIDPPTPDQGARRVWADSKDRVWVSEWNAGKVARYDPKDESWKEWDLAGEAQAYAVFVDDRDVVWLSDFGSNAIVRFDPSTEKFKSYDLPASPGNVRQILGRPGEVWGAESAADALIVIRT